MLNWIVWNRTICIKMNLALNNLQSLICYTTQPTNLSCTGGNSNSLRKARGCTNYKRVTITKGGQDIQMHTFEHLNKSIIPKEIKMRYYYKKVEQYIPSLLRCFKCQKYRHYKENYWEHLTWGRSSQKDPDHIEEDCPNQILKSTYLPFEEFAIYTKEENHQRKIWKKYNICQYSIVGSSNNNQQGK